MIRGFAAVTLVNPKCKENVGSVLRQLLDWPNPRITRPQLLAACHNRWRCGYYIEIEGDWK